MSDLLASSKALLALDADGALVPHGLGGHGRGCLSWCVEEIERLRGTAKLDDEPGKQVRHPRTVMLDLLEALRLAVRANREHLSDAQILAVLSSVEQDHIDSAFHALSQPNK